MKFLFLCLAIEFAFDHGRQYTICLVSSRVDPRSEPFLDRGNWCRNHRDVCKHTHTHTQRHNTNTHTHTHTDTGQKHTHTHTHTRRQGRNTHTHTHTHTHIY